MNFSPKIKIFRSYSILLTIFICINLFKVSKQGFHITYLANFTSKTDYWDIDQKYIYYIDIQDYNINDENVLQIAYNDRKVLENLIVSEIDESLINNIHDNINEEDIIKKNDLKQTYSIKKRQKRNIYYYDIPFKKISEKQKKFVILVEPKLEYNDTQVVLYVSCPIPNFYIYKKDIDNGNIFTKTLNMHNKIEKYFKFNLINISLEEANLIFYIYDKYVSIFYLDNIISKDIKARMFILEKNTTNKLNHTIYLALLGESNNSEMKITLDYHDIKYYYNYFRDSFSFYIEKLNCEKDFYLFENYEDKNITSHLLITPIYGDYELVYYDTILGRNLNDIFKPNNEILITEKIKVIEGDFNILKLSCEKPTLIKLSYLKEEEIGENIEEGKEIITYMPENCYEKKYIITDSFDKHYILIFEIIGETEKYNYTKVDLYNGNIGPITLESTYNTQKPFSFYHEEFIKNNVIDFQIYDFEAYIKVFLISNLYYKNIIDGVTRINSDTKAISFKVRKDIIFDYFRIIIYSHNKSNLISCDYDLKIVKPEDMQNGNVLLGINKVEYYNQKEINIQFSNPYNKYSSRIQEKEYVYFLASFIIKTDDIYPLYTDIRYYYNDKIINLQNSQAKILLNEKEYRVFGDNNYTDKNKILINLNKCNINRTYYIKEYYETDKNIIGEKKISEKRTILLQDNIFHNINFKLYSNDSSDLTDDNSNSKNIASYYQNGDIYMNYFSLNEKLYNSVKLTNDFTISYKDNRQNITLNWNDYIINKEIINNLQFNYSLYILPKESPIKSICQMSLIPPNISLINENKYEIHLSKGNYKIGILASVVNNEFPITTFYDILFLDVPTRINIVLIILISFGVVILIIIITLVLYCKKKSNKDKDIRFSKATNMISMAKFFGYDDEEDEAILNNNEKLIINNESNDKIKDNKDDDDEGKK